MYHIFLIFGGLHNHLSIEVPLSKIVFRHKEFRVSSSSQHHNVGVDLGFNWKILWVFYHFSAPLLKNLQAREKNLNGAMVKARRVKNLKLSGSTPVQGDQLCRVWWNLEILLIRTYNAEQYVFSCPEQLNRWPCPLVRWYLGPSDSTNNQTFHNTTEWP